MKIGLADNNQLRFSGDLKDHWESRGHEVRYEMGASEHIAQWADLYFLDFWDNSIHYLYNWYQDHPEARKPKIVVRAVDWEVWVGLARDQRIIDWVDTTICIAPHIERKLRADNRWDNLHLIKCGVDTDKFPLITRKMGTNVVIPCNEIDWILKNVIEGIKIVGTARARYSRPFTVYIKGKWTNQAGGEYFRHAISDVAKKLHLEVILVEERVDDYNAFLEQMDYAVIPSLKEAYSYVTAQCASKGIVPIINNWLGAEDLWSKKWLYTTYDEAVEMFSKHEGRSKIRKWVLKNSNIKDMLAQYDELLGT